MPIELQFIDWSQPALPAAARWLAERFAEGANLDLAKLIVCVPGGQARRRLLELLVEVSVEQGLMLAPPQIVTPGHLPELLYEAKQPFASDLTQQLAWVKVLQDAGPSELAPLVAKLPEPDDLSAWLALGQMLSGLHCELAADGLDCSDVLKEAAQCDRFNETRRWKLLSELEHRYLRSLDELQVWDKQTARLFAVRHHECRTERRIVLIGLVDLNRSQRQILDQVAAKVTALVFAPCSGIRENSGRSLHGILTNSATTSPRELFDEHGCLRPERWQDVLLPVDDRQIEIADGPGDQAEAVIRAIAVLDGRYAAEQIAIGVPDRQLVPFVRQRLEESNLPARHVGGTPLSRTGPYQLLSEVADYLENRRFGDLAALLRHPALARRLAKSIDVDWLTLVDQFYTEHLPARVSDSWPKRSRVRALMHKVKGSVEATFLDLSRPKQPLGAWAQPILNLLTTVYDDEGLTESREPDRTILLACDKIRDVVKTHLEIDESLSPAVTGAGAMRMLLRQLEGETIPPRASDEAIELLGWLELIWDDAPATIVCGFNEGSISKTVGGDLFLPNALRQRLGLDDNDRRLARDKYALGMIASSRERLHLIAGRRSAANDPLVPSRLLFACPTEELARRTLRLFSSPPLGSRILLPGSLRPGRENSNLPVPEPPATPTPVPIFRVTEFRDYLACPYRYYLRHQLKLEALADSAQELDAGQFGSLLHEALMHFGRSELVDSTNPEEIRDRLFLALGELTAARFGGAAQPAVQVQIELLKQRLEAFAGKQAQRRAQGWRIMHVEKEFGDREGNERPARFPVDGQPALLAGRVDRIDRHEATGVWAVLDYKSSEKAEDPAKTHRKGDDWVDLQLPLYRHLVRELNITGEVKLGYVQLPKDTAKTDFKLADWTDDDLRRADEAAREVVRRIRNGLFWPPAVEPPAFCDDFAAICQDGLLGSVADLDEEEAISE